MKGILEIDSLNEVKLVEICLYLNARPKHFFLLIFKSKGSNLIIELDNQFQTFGSNGEHKIM